MNWERVADVGLAVALVVAFGVSAAAMDSAVTTDPDDVVDLDTHLLPVGSDQVGEFKREVVEPTDTAADADNEQRRGGSGQSDDVAQREQAGADGGSAQSNAQSDSQGQTGTTSEIDWLQWLLQQLLSLALLLLGALGAVVAGVLVGRNRDRLRALLAALLGRLGVGNDPETAAEPAASTRPDCPNEVAGAWYEMVCCLGLDDERSKTPDECAAAAIDAGYDPEVVRTLTEAFQHVRYGSHPVTDDLVAQVRAAVEQIREQTDETRRRPGVQQQ